MKKRELEKVWKQLDGCCEAIEKLAYADIDVDYALFGDIVSLKNQIEELIVAKSRGGKINVG
jgi:hypothetical protein